MADRISAKGVTPDDGFANDALDLVEITGVIKWFDVAKGFGFIIPDNGMQDVLLHVTCLRRDGYQTVLEGARVVALIQRRRPWLPGLPHSLHGPVDGCTPIAAAAGQDPCSGDADQRAGTLPGQVVQPYKRLSAS